VPYRLEPGADRLTILVNEPVSAAPPLASAPLVAPPDPSLVSVGPELRDIDCKRGPGGEGRVDIKLPKPDTRAMVLEKGGRIIVEVPDTPLPRRLQRRLDLVDLGTPVVAIESRPQGRDVQISIETIPDVEYLAYQVNEVFTLEFRPRKAVPRERHRQDKVSFSGERLTLNFQNIEVRALLQLLADFTGHNLVASDTVTGNVTLRLKNVPWDQALDIILKAKGLTMRQQGSVILVGPTEEVMAREEKEMEASRKIEQLAPLRTEHIQINYAKVADIAQLLQSQRGGGAGKTPQRESPGPNKEHRDEAPQAKGLLSARGSVSFDERTNVLLVQDTADKLGEIRQLVTRLDIPVRQVMIESRVVIASDNFARDLGVRFSYNRLQVNENNGRFNQIYGGKEGTLEIEDYWGTMINDKVPLIVDLPATRPNSAVNFLIGKIGSYLLQLELSAMQQEGRGEIISNPRVLTSDKQAAVIEVGQEIPVVTPGTLDNPPTVKYQDATLKLDVTPHITPDNRIIMGLKISKNEADEALKVDGNPYINKRTVETNVLVDNGEAVVLGGVFERTQFTTRNQVPWLGNLPILGHLFKNDARKETNQELLIFVTPKILQPELKTR